MSKTLENRHEFVLLFEVQDGNPNGDPDAGNLPRVDPETGEGLVTDVCLKRKVRNYVALAKGEDPAYKIFIREKAVLNQQIERAYTESDDVKAATERWDAWKKNKKLPRPERHFEDVARQWMCDNFFDVRTFGAVMSTGDKQEAGEGESKIKKTAGQVRGPVQITFARSVVPVVSLEHSITRMAVTNEKDLEKERTMGRKHTIPYGLYRAHGFVSAPLSKQTGFSEDDLGLLWESLVNMFEHDRSAARGQMATRGLYVFRHDNELGRAPAHTLFERVRVSSAGSGTPARRFSDFQVEVDEAGLPQGVTLQRMIG